MSGEELLRRAEACQRYLDQRDDIFGESVAREPSWDILLATLIAQLEKRPISIADLGKNIDVPSTTVLRHLSVLELRGLVQKAGAARDKRVRHVLLTQQALEHFMEFFTLLPNPDDGNVPPTHPQVSDPG